MRRDDRRVARVGRVGRVEQVGLLGCVAWAGYCAAAVVMCLASLSAQTPFDQAVADLTSADAGVRLRAAQTLKATANRESAIPLARLVTDSRGEVQLEAIAAEINIFLAEKIIPRKRVGFVIEVRRAVAAETAFSDGPQALGPRPVPLEVLAALRTAVRDDDPRIGLEALYAFGTLAFQPGGNERRELLRTSAPDLAALVGAVDPDLRYAAVRVLGRLFERRPNDDALDESVGDALVAAMNDKDPDVKSAAMQALGALRYDRAVQALSDQFQYYGKGVVAEASLDALAHIANPSSAPLLLAALGSKTPAVRGIGIEGLARLGDPARLSDIESATRVERVEGVRLAAAFAAAMLGNGSLDSIGDALWRPRARDQAKQYLVEIARVRAARLTDLLQHADARFRADAADAVGVAGDPGALKLVEPLLGDQEPEVARAAERAVARLRAATRKPIS